MKDEWLLMNWHLCLLHLCSVNPIFESTQEHRLFSLVISSLAILTYLADKPAYMQLPLTWTVSKYNHSKLLDPCRIDQRSNKNKLYEVKRGETEDREVNKY